MLTLDSLDTLDTLDALDTIDMLGTLDTLDTIHTSYITCNGYYKTFKLFGHGRTDSRTIAIPRGAFAPKNIES